MHGYPRPQLQRPSWTSLNGSWEFALDADGLVSSPHDVHFSRSIVVPFAPETDASGVGETGLFRACWYRRTFETPALAPGERLILHFGAVDSRATVWLNGHCLGAHEGGYTPFSFDVTDALINDAEQCLVVRAEDDPADLAKPRGKQDWERYPHDIWYPRTTGVWQTVWYEVVPECRIDAVQWRADVGTWSISTAVAVTGQGSHELSLTVRLTKRRELVTEDTFRVLAGEVERTIRLPDPGTDSGRKAFLWSPAQPNILEAELILRDAAGRVLDRVESYTAMRSVGVRGNRFMLNGRPFRLRMVLDQGYWPESGMTAPDDDALRRDVELARAMGFNGVRKHQKIDDPRYLYWADMLGLLVWEEMPSAYRFSSTAVARTTQGWMEAIARDSSHPCVVTWVPFNESWGVPGLFESSQQRAFVTSLQELTRALDPDRPVVMNDGWESGDSDIIGVHDYEQSAAGLLDRYGDEAALVRTLATEHPGGRWLALEGADLRGRPVVLSEFGGIAYSAGGRGDWGYTTVGSEEALAERFETLLAAVGDLEPLAGWCYTQFCDTYQETNGLLWPDRTPKLPLPLIAAAVRGKTNTGYAWPHECATPSAVQQESWPGAER